MYRKIQSHYAGTCNSCKKFFEAGTSVYWQKGTYGFFCVSCYEKAGNVAKKSGTNSDTTFTIDWRDLRKFVVDVIEDNPVKMTAGNLRTAQKCIKHVYKDFHGYTPIGLRTWIREGYSAQGLGQLMTPNLQDKRRYIYSEDADEIHVDKAISGEDLYRGEWTKEKRIPGVRLKVDIGFRGDVSASVVSEFNVWVSSVCRSLEDSGIDSQIIFRSTSDNTIPGMERTTVEIMVKRENEQADFKAFTPLLSPAAFRTFVFATRVLQGESLGKQTSPGFGASVIKSWNVEFNRAERTIEITSSANAYSFPAEEMTLKLRKALEELRQAS